MSLAVRVLAVGATWLLVDRFSTRYRSEAALLAAGALWVPVPTIVCIVAVGAVIGRRRLAARRRVSDAADDDVMLLSELSLLGLSGGLTFTGSLSLAAGHVVAPLRHEVLGVLRRSRYTGTEHGLGQASGRAADLYQIAARAAATGASVSSAVQAFVEERRAVEGAAALAEARRLPVRLLFPLALLILPGFMVLTVGPAVVSAVERLTS